jgi:transcriptional regulator
MYKPKIYIEKDENKIRDFIEHNPFALISGKDKLDRQVATQVPLLYDDKKQVLQGHIMKKTDHFEAFLKHPEVLVVFSGPNAYISASWYKQAHAASTWNYMSVQIRGKLTFLKQKDFVELMQKFTLKFENGNTDSPTVYQNIPEDYRRKHMKAIAGFNIKIESVEATFKLSQDKDIESFENILEKLKNKSYQEQWLAEEMKKNKSFK